MSLPTFRAIRVTPDMIVALISLGVSVVIGGFAIWLSVHFKDEADRVNERTLELLVEIKTHANVIENFTSGELKSWGDVGRRVVMSGTFTSMSDTLKTGGINDPPNAAAANVVASPTSGSGGTNAGGQ